MSSKASAKRLTLVVHALSLEVDTDNRIDANVVFGGTLVIGDVYLSTAVNCLRSLLVAVLQIELIVNAVTQLFMTVTIIVAFSYAYRRRDIKHFRQLVAITEFCRVVIVIVGRMSVTVAMVTLPYFIIVIVVQTP